MTPLAAVAIPTPTHAPQRAAEPTPAPQPVAGHVLVLDGGEERRALLADVVTRAGGYSTPVATGAQAIERLRERQAQCLLVAGLPDGSRRAFINWARPRHPQLAIVAVADDEGQAIELYNAGADIVVTLPFDPDLLGATLAAATRSAQRPHLQLV